MEVDLEVHGADQAMAWLFTTPPKLLRAAQKTARIGGVMSRDAIRADTHVRTGRLLASWRLEVRDGPTGAIARVSSDLRYTKYVERGTREHGKAQRMAKRGGLSVIPAEMRVFDYEIRSAL